MTLKLFLHIIFNRWFIKTVDGLYVCQYAHEVKNNTRYTFPRDELDKAVLYTDEVLGNENDESELISEYYTLDLIRFPYRVDKKREHKLIKKRKCNIYLPK